MKIAEGFVLRRSAHKNSARPIGSAGAKLNGIDDTQAGQDVEAFLAPLMKIGCID